MTAVQASAPPWEQCQLDLQNAMASLPTPSLCEHSVKLSPGRWGDARTLVSVPTARLTNDQLIAALDDVFGRWSFPESARAEVVAALMVEPTASRAQEPRIERPRFLHLGLEGERRKVYWEYALPDKVASSAIRHVQYRAWKCRPAELRATCSDYVLLPTAEAARSVMQQQLRELPPLVGDLVEQLEISTALAQRPWPPLAVRIEERLGDLPTARDSLNLHMHQSGLPLGAIGGLTMALAREWGSAPRQTLMAWIARYGQHLLGNISFGLGDDRQPFFTCYYAAERRVAGSRHLVPPLSSPKTA